MKKGFFTKKRIVAGAIVLVVVLLGAGAVYAADMWDKITNRQMDLFYQTLPPLPEDSGTPEHTQSGTPEGSQTPGGNETAQPTTGAPDPTATIDIVQDITGKADKTIMKNILHVLLIGVDYEEVRLKWDKLNFNSDVMLLLAIDFEANKVDMISFPRDTYAKIANIDPSAQDSFSKLNFSLAAGGGINDEGFKNVCKSVKGILGDKIPYPIDYYIAVTMPAVKELVDKIGGVDYDVDIEFKIGDRPAYKKGFQHLDGQGVLDYCRVRKSHGTGYIIGPTGDVNRTDRQRRMLTAVFKKLQKTASLWNVPDILLSMKGKVFLNKEMDIGKLAALALFGMKLKEGDISMHALPTSGFPDSRSDDDLIFNSGFQLQKQDKRIDLFREVYGITVDPLYKYDVNYAVLLWRYMCGEAWLKEIDKWSKLDVAKLPEERKFYSEDIAQLQILVADTQKLMTKYRTKLFVSSKPTVSKTEWMELSDQVWKLRNHANNMCYKAGYKISWHVPTPEVLNMDE